MDCLMFIALLALILSLSFAAFYRALENSRNLSRNAADIARTLNAGDRWREDVRSTTGPPRLSNDGAAVMLQLPQATGEVRYVYREGAVFRQATPLTNWLAVLASVRSSQMIEQRRQRITSWRWEVELQGRQPVARVKPLFSFQAVPRNQTTR
jgi:hypothetical protein